MKKKLSLLVVAVVMCILPIIGVSAAPVSTNLAEAVAEEIETFGQYEDYADYIKKLKKFDSKNYEPGKAAVKVYIFRGNTCTHCLAAVTYFAQIYPKYKDVMEDLFRQIVDVGESENNSRLQENILKFTDYRNYLDFDLIMYNKDTGDEQRLSKMMKKKS